MSTLITGGAGFIGSNLAKELLEAGEDVVVLGNMHTGSPGNLMGLQGKLKHIKMGLNVEAQHVENPIKNYVQHTFQILQKRRKCSWIQSEIYLEEGVKELLQIL